MKYTILMGFDAPHLIDLVNAEITKGWVPLGGPISRQTGGVMWQAMTKDDPVPVTAPIKVRQSTGVR